MSAAAASDVVLAVAAPLSAAALLLLAAVDEAPRGRPVDEDNAAPATGCAAAACDRLVDEEEGVIDGRAIEERREEEVAIAADGGRIAD